MVELFFFTILLGIIAILIIKYFDGEFTYRDEIIDIQNLTDGDGGLITTVYTIKRTYNSSRIKIIKTEIRPLN